VDLRRQLPADFGGYLLASAAGCHSDLGALACSTPMVDRLAIPVRRPDVSAPRTAVIDGPEDISPHGRHAGCLLAAWARRRRGNRPIRHGRETIILGHCYAGIVPLDGRSPVNVDGLTFAPAATMTAGEPYPVWSPDTGSETTLPAATDPVRSRPKPDRRQHRAATPDCPRCQWPDGVTVVERSPVTLRWRCPRCDWSWSQAVRP
jgi:hypothetical protein